MLAHKMKVAVAAVFFGAGAMVGAATAAHAQDTSPKISAAPESSSADNPSWKEYKKILENYYFLDKQKSGHISCSVSERKLQGFINGLREMSKNQLTVDENIHDWSVTYDRTKGISINSPHLKASVLPGLKSADDEQTEIRRKGIEVLFNKVVLEVEGNITLAIANMIFPSPKSLKNLSLTKNGDTTVVSYDYDEGKHSRTIYSGSTEKRTQSSPTSNITITEDYQPLNGKLAMAHFAGEKTEGSAKINQTISISYQDLGSVFFPAQILNTVSDDTQQTKTHHFEINFKDCKTSGLSP